MKIKNPSKTIPPLIFAITLLAIYLGASKNYYLLNFPGYFVLLTSIVLTSFYLAYKKSLFIHKDFTYLLLGIFFSWVLLSWAFTEMPWIGFSSITRYLVFCVSICLLVCLFESHHTLQEKVVAILWISILIVSIVYFVHCCLQKTVPYGFCFPFGNPNVGSSVIAFGLILLGGELYQSKSNHQYKYLIAQTTCAIWFLFLLYFLKSEAVVFSLLVSAGLILFLFSKKKWIYILSGILTAFALFPFIPSIINKAWNSIEIRKYLWIDTLELIGHSTKTLFLGWGSGSFFAAYPPFANPETFTATYATSFVDYPHNYTLELLAELGILGTLLFIALCSYVLWQFYLNCKNKQGNYQDYVFITALLFFLIHAQLSICFSLFQIQFFVSLIIAYSIATKAPINNKIYLSPKIAYPLAICLLIGWKFYAWDFLHFHKQYKNAVTTYLNNPKQGIEEIVAVPIPKTEDYYTLHWRHSLGGILIESYETSPRFVTESLDPFKKLQQWFPSGYGHYWLRQAVLHAKQNKKTQADQYFTKSAQKNPFFNRQWLYWSIAIKNNQATIKAMEKALANFSPKYQEDGTILLAKGLIAQHKNDPIKARDFFEKSLLWTRKRRGMRANELSSLLSEFLRK